MITKEQAIDILEMFDFFQGQRAGRELWNDIPFEVQEQDIKDFARGVALLKEYIADVVPKSKVERLEEELAKANADVKTYVKVAEYHQGLSVKRYHEIKRRNEDIERLQKALDAYEETSGLKQAKAEVAREIVDDILSKIRTMIKEIEKVEKCGNSYYSEFNGGSKTALEIVFKDIAELKKKYIPKDCRTCKHMLSCEPNVFGICDEYEEENKNGKENT